MKAGTMPQQEAALLELHYLPSIQYFSKLAHYPTVYIEQQEHYQKGSYRNRCHIVGANGPLRLSVPLQQGKNEQQQIRDVRIAYKEPWRQQHWQSIRSAYGSAPYFDHYADRLSPFFTSRYDTLFELSWALLQAICGMIPLSVGLLLTETYIAEAPGGIIGLRDTIHPKAHRGKPDPHFLPAFYPQVFEEKHGFLPNLSILDLLFCTGPQAAIILENSFIEP
ncbi:MAG: WbqC family protein [Phaeodactylibacter sp.]|nr:WbqC family protein [Phaeodactylibacter sp.]MCB9275851.1 WbqC family protein [Lewinellaceae bacterium]